MIVETKFGRVGTHPPLDTLPIVLSDTDDVSFPDTPAGLITFARAFTPDIDGVISVKKMNGSSVLVNVKADVQKVGVVRRFNIAGTTVGMTGIMEN